MRWLLIITFLLVSCTEQRPPEPSLIRPAIDSTCCLQRDSLRAKLREQSVLIKLARLQMKRYAKIIARDPSQSRFLIGWTDRAFDGAIDSSH